MILKERYFFSWNRKLCDVIIAFFGAKISNEKIKKKNKKKKTSANTNNTIMSYAIDHEGFVLINLYSSNVEVEEVETICELDQLLCKFFIDSYKKSIFAGAFNLFFKSNLETSRSNLSLKTKAISKIV